MLLTEVPRTFYSSGSCPICELLFVYLLYFVFLYSNATNLNWSKEFFLLTHLTY
jgi:hypothetical protein